MESTVENLEAMFKRTEADLDLLSSKIEMEFEQSKSVGDQINPSQLVTKVKEVKKEYSNIVEEVKAVRKAQEDTMDFFKGELMNLCASLKTLQSSTGVKIEPPAELEKVKDMLGIKEPETPTSPAELLSPGPDHEETEEGHTYLVSPTESTQTSKAASSKPKSPTLAKPKGPKSKRRLSRSADSGVFEEITDMEFESVSTLIRGRVKLADVNNVYRTLWKHFKEDGNSEPLTAKDMYKMGLRVTGQTGEAKLKVLRALKLLHISPSGEVKMV